MYELFMGDYYTHMSLGGIFMAEIEREDRRSKKERERHFAFFFKLLKFTLQ